MQKGLESLQRRSFKLAIEYFTRAIDLEESAPEPYFNRGVAYFEFEDITKALRDFEKVAEEWPSYNKSTYLYLSMIYARLGDTNYALSYVSLLLIL
jgi:tetratricopeptide (TPR) repeat protein